MRTEPVRFTKGHQSREHAHAWDQLSFAVSGAMTVSTVGASWFVPSDRAVWIPVGTVHAEHYHGDVAVRSLYVAPRLARVGRACRTINVSPLLRELIVHACRYGALDRRVAEQRHLGAILLDLLAAAPVEPLHLPMPKDARALRLAERMLEAPNRSAAISGSGASRRTLERLFARETGLALGAWRRRLRVLHSLRTLAAGGSVTEAALSAGYASTSAFIALFRRELGTTPSRFGQTPGRPLRL
ncbi:MAG TPA: helix-turn-helix transcriptional regulator [Polyangiales bacterium]|nr:helix-turn-helix transcriptional regulator [Polyangiales bacterium]